MLCALPSAGTYDRSNAMVNPFGAILSTSYPQFKQLGFRIIRDDDYDTIMSSADNTIVVSVERYHPANICLSFVDDDGEVYPLSMIRSLIDSVQHDQDTAKLVAIKTEFGLHDGSRGMAIFRQGVKLHTRTYMELATRFLQAHLHNINFKKDQFRCRFE